MGLILAFTLVSIMKNLSTLTPENQAMSAESFGGFATLVKLYGFKAALGMVGAAMLYIVLPPLRSMT